MYPARIWQPWFSDLAGFACMTRGNQMQRLMTQARIMSGKYRHGYTPEQFCVTNK